MTVSNQTEVNANPDEFICIHTRDVPWSPTAHAGVCEKVLERIIDPEKGRVTALMRFAPGAAMPTQVLGTRTEIFVLEGSLSDGLGTYGRRTFVRNPAGTEVSLSSAEGCEFYVKHRNPFRADDERMVIDTEAAEWTAFPHRGAEVIHFYRDRHGIDTARCGKAYADVRIPSHDHSMGEESLVLEGELKDEHGNYPVGAWFRFPIGVPHAPFTEGQSCTMLIREGDLVW